MAGIGIRISLVWVMYKDYRYSWGLWLVTVEVWNIRGQASDGNLNQVKIKSRFVLRL